MPTVLDSGSSGAPPPTIIDKPTSPGSSWVAARLVPPIADKYDIVRELDSGSEAHVLLVRSKAGRELVYKTYHERDRVVPSTGQKIATSSRSKPGSEHLVTIVESGEYDSRWWEIQEHCTFGSLRAHMKSVDPFEVLRQVTAALMFVHGPALELVHRDLKPENILVRSLSPLRLVLGDFGLVYDMKPGTMMFGKAERTPGYEPPETFHGNRALITRKTDWWALGMIMAEIKLGRHLLAPPGGALSTDPDEIMSLIWDGVSVSDVKDPRWKMLCGGLLRRNRANRWDGTQVLQWLSGGSPTVVSDVPDDAIPPIVGGAGSPGGSAKGPVRAATRPWAFNGREYDNPVLLADALQSQWSQASDLLAADVASSRPLKALQEFCIDAGFPAAARAIGEMVTASNPADRRLALVLVDLNPDLQPIWRGARIDRAGLEARAIAIVNGSSRGSDRDFLQALRTSGVMGVYAKKRGCDGHGALEEQWNQATIKLQHAIEAEVARGNGSLPTEYVQQADAWLLLTLLDASHRKSLTAMFSDLDVGVAVRRDWFRRLHDGARPGRDAALMLLCIGYERIATEQQNLADAESRRVAAAEAERARAAADAARAGRRITTIERSMRVQWVATAVLAIASAALIVTGIQGHTSWITGKTEHMPDFAIKWLVEANKIAPRLSLQRADSTLLVVGVVLGAWALLSFISVFRFRAALRIRTRSIADFWILQRWIVYPLGVGCLVLYWPWLAYWIVVVGLYGLLIVAGIAFGLFVLFAMCESM